MPLVLQLVGLQNHPSKAIVNPTSGIADRVGQREPVAQLIVGIGGLGRVAAEAMMNGIPVIGSTRGALPEVIGEAGVLLNIPERITPDSRELPTDEEILPWKQAIERLWDNPAYYAEIAKRAKSRAELWSVDSIIAEFERL